MREAKVHTPSQGEPIGEDVGPHSNLTRREFLVGAASVAAGLPRPASNGEKTATLPTVPLGPSRVTRLIVGGNPIYGYSHFNRLFDQHMLEYFTDERVVQLLLDCEKAGINTWQSSFHEGFKRHHPAMRAAGCKIQWICLAAPWDVDPSAPRTPENVLAGMLKCAETVARYQPVAISHHGSATDFLWRAGRIDDVKTFLNKVHDLGIPAGVSTHNPVILEAIEAKGWSTDFYMAGLYYLTRRPSELEKEIGVVPVGETYLPTDPPRMCKVVRQVRKPCLVYKLLAAGRKCHSAREVRQCFEFAFSNIKPTDAAIVGMYPRYSDQIAENARIVREILA
jgi:hypothetical protein